MQFKPLKNDRLLKVIKREPVDATPIWIMRQAGRYLPEYRATRQRAGSFMRLCQTPELACEVTLQPIERFNLDAAIIFSDILTIPDAMGMGLHFIEGKGPVFTKKLHASDIKRLSAPAIEQLAYVYDAIRLVKKELIGKLPLIGFSGSPWTLALYMLEGKATPGFPKAREFANTYPHEFQQLLSLLTSAVTAHLTAQMAAGADVVMLFDSWGGLLTNKQDYEIYSLSYLKKIILDLKNSLFKDIPIILFSKGTQTFLESMAVSGCDVLGLDWEISLREARSRVGQTICLQGNMNPSDLLKSEKEIKLTVENILADYGASKGHIFNLGHGITPDVPPAHVAALVEAVHEYSRCYHQQQKE